MHMFPGSVLSPLLSPPSSECTTSSKGSIIESLVDKQEHHKLAAALNYPLSPMSNSTPPLAYRASTSYSAASNSTGASRSPPVPYSPAPRSAGSVDVPKVRDPSPIRGASLLPPVTPSDYRQHPEFASPTRRLENQSSSYFPHQSPGQQPFSPPQQPPRRAKAHVPSACVNCKNAHLACDVQRPCPRCISTGKQDTCVDVEHKKRGRPRLRDVRHSFEISRAIDSRSGLNLEGRPPSPGSLNGRGLRLPGPERVGRTSISSRTAPYTLSDPARHDGARSMFPESPRQSFDASSVPPPTAYLTTDLVVASSTGSFQDLLGFQAHDLNLRRTVYDLATDSPTDLKNLDRVLRCIKAIVQQEDPQYRTPPPQEVYNVLQRSSSTDLRANLQGAPIIEEYFDFRRANATVIKGFARFYLSRSTVYFVAMEVSVVRNRSHTGPSNRVPEIAPYSHLPHRNSVDSSQRPPHRRSLPSPGFPPHPHIKPLQSSPSTPALSRVAHAPPSGHSTPSTYPPPVQAQVIRREASMELKPNTGLPVHNTTTSLRQYSVAPGSYASSLDTRSTPGSIMSPGVGVIYSSPTEITPRTEHIQLPPLRGIPSISTGGNREQGTGDQFRTSPTVKHEPAADSISTRRGIGLSEIVE